MGCDRTFVESWVVAWHKPFTFPGAEHMEPVDPVLQRAEQRLEELRQETDKLKEFLVTYRMLANSLKLESANTTGTKGVNSQADTTPVDKPEGAEAGEVAAADDSPAKRVRVRDNPPSAVVIAAAVNLMRATGRPMSRREVREGLLERGVVVNGKDPVKTMGTILWRAPDQIVAVPGRGYWVAGVPAPSLGERLTQDEFDLFT